MINALFSLFGTAIIMSAVILLLLLFFKFFGDRFTAKCRYIVWIIVILRLCIPFGGSFIPKLIKIDISIPEIIFDTEYEVPLYDSASVQSPIINSETATSSASASETQNSLPITSPQAPKVNNTDIKIEYENEFDTTYASAFSLPGIDVIIFALWISGAVIFLAVKLLSYNIYRNKLMRSRVLPDKEICRIYADVCEKLEIAHPPRLYISNIIGSPLLYGYFQRTVLLPNLNYSEDGLKGVLTHELIHHKRGDLWIKFIGVIANSLFFFDPLVYAALSRLDCEMELSCDEKLLSGLDSAARLSYGTYMLEIVKRTRRRESSLTTFYSPAKGALKERFMNIIEEKTRKHGRLIVALVLILCTLAGSVIGCGVKKNESTGTESYFKNGDVITLTPEAVEFSEVTFKRKEIDTLAKYTSNDNALNTFLKQNDLYIMSEPTSSRNSNYFELIYKNGSDPVCIYAGNAEEMKFEGKSFNKLLNETGFCFGYYVSGFVDVYFSTSDGGIPKPFFKSTDGTSLVDVDRNGEYEIVTDSNIYTAIDGKAVKFNVGTDVSKHFGADSEKLSIRFPYSSYNYVYSITYEEQPADDGTYNRHSAKMTYADGTLIIEPEKSEYVNLNTTFATSNKSWKMYRSMKYNAIVLENGDKSYGYAIGSSASPSSVSKDFKGKKFSGISIGSDSYAYISKDETRAAVFDNNSYRDKVIIINLSSGDIIATIDHSSGDILRFHELSDFVLAPYQAIYSEEDDTYVEARYTFDLELEELDNAYRLIYTLKTNDTKISLKGSITYDFSSYGPDEYEVIETNLSGIENNTDIYSVRTKKAKYSDTVMYAFSGTGDAPMMMYTSDLEGNYYQPCSIGPLPIDDYSRAEVASFGNYNDTELLYMTVQAAVYNAYTDMLHNRYFVYMANPESMLDSTGNPTKPLVWNFAKEISVDIYESSTYEYGITVSPTSGITVHN